MTNALSKHDIQDWLRGNPWTFHLVIDPADLRRASDDRALKALRIMNYELCRQLLGRYFRQMQLDERFHWVGFFQGSRDAGTRHLHVLIHVPERLRPSTPFAALKLKSAIQTAWLCARDRVGPPLIWVRAIQDDGDSRSVATYVSRHCSVAAWNEKDVHFSH
jgi:hypothetical protein